MQACVLTLDRAPFLDFAADSAERSCAQSILQLLIAQDGTTTQLLESLAGEKLTVHVLDQAVIHELPPNLVGRLPGRSFLRRLTTLQAKGQVLLDSLSYIAIDVLPQTVVLELWEGAAPIGRVLSRLWTRRRFSDDDHALLEELWDTVGCPDPEASRSLCIEIPRGPCMILAETFRQGALALVRSAARGSSGT